MTMTPTAELRFIVRSEPPVRRILQQRWVQHHIPAGMNQAPSEWRDVPLVHEKGEKK